MGLYYELLLISIMLKIMQRKAERLQKRILTVMT